MRNRFVYMLDIRIHNELHNVTIHDIPKPTAQGIVEIWRLYTEHETEIMGMNIVQAAEWLSEACYDEPYHTCMKHQAEFLKARLG